MIFAEIHGKLGDGYSRASDRSEDLLTSTAFGLLRYLPPGRGLIQLLRRARVVTQAADDIYIEQSPTWLRLDDNADIEVEFWPSLGESGQPDLRLTLTGTQNQREVILIEVKLHSGKSQLVRDDDLVDDKELEEDGGVDLPIDPDQLIRYYRAQEHGTDGRVSLIYLTAHTVPPREDLLASLRPGMRLAWLSWTDVWAVAHDARDQSLAAADLSDLLHHKGLSTFDGFSAIKEELPPLSWSGAFWREPSVRRRENTSFFAWSRSPRTYEWLRNRPRFFDHRERGPNDRE